MKKYFNLGVLAAGLCLASSTFAATHRTFFSASATVQSSVYYCTGDDFNQTCSESPASLIPTTPVISDASVEGLNTELPSDASEVGAVLGGSTPDKMWVHLDGGRSGEDGLAMQPSALVGQSPNGKSIPVSAYYVPCGQIPSPDGAITGVPKGTLLNATTATSIDNNSSSQCSSGGNVYLVFNVEQAKLANGFVSPDTYQGDLNLVMQGLSQ